MRSNLLNNLLNLTSPGTKTDVSRQLKDSLQFKCDVGVLARSLASLHLLRLQWAGWESKGVDLFYPCNIDAKYDTDLEEAAAAYGLDDDDPYGMW